MSSNYHDEQLYLFSLLYKLKAHSEVKNSTLNKKVLDSKNYVLISYYIINNMFDSIELDIIKGYIDESYWLVYYYLILCDSGLYGDLDNSIQYYLIPKKAKTQDVKDAYKKFYKDNLNYKKEILVSLDNVVDYIDLYFDEKYKKEDSEETVVE